MPFFRKVPISPMFCTGYKEKIPTDEGGRVVYKEIDLSKQKLGKAEDYDLQKLLDSGVDLKQTNPNILGRHVSASQLDDLTDGLENLTIDDKEK